MPSTEFYILGQKYTIKGEASPEHMKLLVKDVDARVKDVCSKYPNITPMNALILTAFNMAEEIHSLKSSHESLARDIDEKAEALTRLFD
jgi:cell division protein ZapA